MNGISHTLFGTSLLGPCRGGTALAVQCWWVVMSVAFSLGQKLTPYVATQVEQWVTTKNNKITVKEELDRANIYKALQ